MPETGKDSSTFVTGTTSADAVAFPDEGDADVDGCTPESSETVGIASVVVGEAQAETPRVRTMTVNKSTFFIYLFSP
jgi:hypothetical protein